MPEPASSKTAEAEEEVAAEDQPPVDPAALLRALEAIAEHEARFTERFYEIFFDRRPDTLELFGAHAIAEREEMMAETLHSIHALGEEQTWLADNLAALGRSHWEYGVTRDMYPDFVETLVDCSKQVLGAEIDSLALAALRSATTEITRQMSEAGEAAAIKRSG